MFGHRPKGKSSPINLVTPGDVISAQQLLRVEQDSLKLFFTRGYRSYTFVGFYGVLALLTCGSCVWIGTDREMPPAGMVFVGLEIVVSVLAVVEVVWRLGLGSICEFLKEPLHWLDLGLLSLWFASLGLLQTGQSKYHSAILAGQTVFVCRIAVLCGYLIRQLRTSSHYEAPNLNVLNISQMPGEVEVVALDESGNNSQPSQLQGSSRIAVDVRIEKNVTYFSPKHMEAGQKLEVDD